ncbi:MAG: hypothetical protein K6G11_07115 [Lachnospiraceae bacterium]|nr:hypothetical protein [Lachnospiraceae bacterium]
MNFHPPPAALRCFCPRRTRCSGLNSLFPHKKRRPKSLLFFTEKEGFEQAHPASTLRPSIRTAQRTPSQKRLASSATGGASVLLPAPHAVLGQIHSSRKKKKAKSLLFFTEKEGFEPSHRY